MTLTRSEADLRKAVYAGDNSACPRCGGIHEVRNSESANGREAGLLQYYVCGSMLKVVAMKNKLILKLGIQVL